MTINRDKFFEGYKVTFGNLNQSQVDGLTEMLTGFDESTNFDLANQYAGMLSQTARETNWTFQPRIEGYYIKGNRKKALYNFYRRNNPYALKTIFPYGWDSDLTYEGRGRTQTTHLGNYIKISEKLGIDCVNNPDLLLDGKTDMKILDYCYATGLWTGKRLKDYLNSEITDYKNMRRVVNGLDHWREIQSDAEKFYKIIEFE